MQTRLRQFLHLIRLPAMRRGPLAHALLVLVLAATVLVQTYGALHRLDSHVHPAEQLCQICQHSGAGAAPLINSPAPQLATVVTHAHIARTATPTLPAAGAPYPARAPPAFTAC